MLSVDAGKVVLRSRRGTERGPAFPEIVAGAAQLPDTTALDSEAVIYVHGRIDFAAAKSRALSTRDRECRLAEDLPTKAAALTLCGRLG